MGCKKAKSPNPTRCQSMNVKFQVLHQDKRLLFCRLTGSGLILYFSEFDWFYILKQTNEHSAFKEKTKVGHNVFDLICSYDCTHFSRSRHSTHRIQNKTNLLPQDRNSSHRNRHNNILYHHADSWIKPLMEL